MGDLYGCIQEVLCTGFYKYRYEKDPQGLVFAGFTGDCRLTYLT